MAGKGVHTDVATGVCMAVGGAVSWGFYCPTLHKGQVALGNPMRALLCVGVAYFLVGVIVPVVMLSSQGGLSGFNSTGTMAATFGGGLGVLGAGFIIFAFRNRGVSVPDKGAAFA